MGARAVLLVFTARAPTPVPPQKGRESSKALKRKKTTKNALMTPIVTGVSSYQLNSTLF